MRVYASLREQHMGMIQEYTGQIYSDILFYIFVLVGVISALHIKCF